MKVLFVCQWFPPEPAIVPQNIVNALVDDGHEVTVVTGQPNYPTGKIADGYRPWTVTRERHEDYTVLRTPLYPSHNGSAPGRVANYLTWAVSSAVATLLLRRHDATLLYSSPATAGLGPWLARRIRGRPYLALVQDVWPDSVTSSGMVRPPRGLGRVALLLLHRLCIGSYRSAERVVVISPGARNLLASRGVPQARIDLIYNWSDAEASSAVLSDRSCIQADGGDFVVTYAGTVGSAQNLDIVLDAAAVLGSDFQFRIVGDGVELPRLRRRAQSLNLENVRFIGRLDSSYMETVYASSDVNLVTLRSDPLFAITMPSKVQALLAAGAPTVCVATGDAGEVIQNSGLGWQVDPDDSEGLVDALRAAKAMTDDERQSLGKSGRQFYDREMARTIGIARLRSALLQTAGRHHQPTMPRSGANKQ